MDKLNVLKSCSWFDLLIKSALGVKLPQSFHNDGRVAASAVGVVPEDEADDDDMIVLCYDNYVLGYFYLFFLICCLYWYSNAD